MIQQQQNCCSSWQSVARTNIITAATRKLINRVFCWNLVPVLQCTHIKYLLVGICDFCPCLLVHKKKTRLKYVLSLVCWLIEASYSYSDAVSIKKNLSMRSKPLSALELTICNQRATPKIEIYLARPCK